MLFYSKTLKITVLAVILINFSHIFYFYLKILVFYCYNSKLMAVAFQRESGLEGDYEGITLRLS